MHSRPRHAATRGAFTLIELLVVLAIVAVLTGLLFSAVQRVRSSAARAACSNRLRQIGLALHGYHGTKGSFPPGITLDAEGGRNQFMSWHTRTLPHLEQEALWKEAIEAFRSEPYAWRPPHPCSRILPGFECPADPRSGTHGVYNDALFGMTSFMGVLGTGAARRNGMLFLDSSVRLVDVTDGTSNTLLVGERPASADTVLGWWYAGTGGVGKLQAGTGDVVLGTRERNYSAFAPQCPVGPYEFGPGKLTNQCDAFHFWSVHPDGAHFAFTDGSVRFLTYGAKSVLPALSTRAGGEVVEVP